MLVRRMSEASVDRHKLQARQSFSSEADTIPVLIAPASTLAPECSDVHR